MKEIPLTRGMVALVDDDDYEEISKHKWYSDKKGYASRDVVENGKRKHLYMHREIAKTPPGKETDHINGIKNDNRKSNLRQCTKFENMRNRGKQTNNTSGHKGVFLSRGKKKWRAQIVVNKKAIHLGSFDTPDDAHIAYENAERKYFGDFIRK